MSANAQVIQGAYEAFARGDVAAVIDVVTDDVEWSSPGTLPQGGDFRGKDGVGAFFQAIGAAWNSLELDVETVCEADGDVVIGVVQASGIRQDATPGAYGAVHVFSLRDGKVARFREFTDLDVSIA